MRTTVRYLWLLLYVALPHTLLACPTCTPPEQTWWQELTHGVRPTGWWEVTFVIVFAVAILSAIVYSIYLIVVGHHHETETRSPHA